MQCERSLSFTAKAPERDLHKKCRNFGEVLLHLFLRIGLLYGVLIFRTAPLPWGLAASMVNLPIRGRKRDCRKPLDSHWDWGSSPVTD